MAQCRLRPAREDGGHLPGQRRPNGAHLVHTSVERAEPPVLQAVFHGPAEDPCFQQLRAGDDPVLEGGDRVDAFVRTARRGMSLETSRIRGRLGCRAAPFGIFPPCADRASERGASPLRRSCPRAHKAKSPRVRLAAGPGWLFHPWHGETHLHPHTIDTMGDFASQVMYKSAIRPPGSQNGDCSMRSHLMRPAVGRLHRPPGSQNGDCSMRSHLCGPPPGSSMAERASGRAGTRRRRAGVAHLRRRFSARWRRRWHGTAGEAARG
jgi:hypothetical protein